MADSRLPEITNEETALADGDLFYVVDVSDTTDDTTGSHAKITTVNLASAVESRMFPADLTADVTGTLPEGNGGSGGTVFDTQVAATSTVTANTAKVTNATHTGDVTGSGALTVDPTAISGKGLVTAVGADTVLILDATDGALKKSLISDFASAGGDMAAATYDPAGISEQVVGLTASQALTNKTLTQPALTLTQSATPTPTAEGVIEWDTDGNQIAIGDGSGTKVFSDDSVNAATYQPIDTELTALGSTTSAADALPYFTGSGTATTTTLTAAGRALIDDASATAQIATLGLDADLATLSVPASTTISTFGATLVDDADAATAIATLGAVPQAQSVNAQTGTTYTLVAADAGKLVTLSNAAAITLTVPQDSAATIAVGTYVDLYQLGAGQVTVAAGAGATLRTSGLTAKARAQYSRLGVQKVSANTWSLFGDLAAS